ncbi:MAG: DUF452 family protein, partial [Candidatus Gastranaerophilales bacterium]|nr:DUF452 family protein [Candidatus Gastranaerophilales bacterium]
MKSYWLNKQNNKNLIVFFAGWSFDYHPFKHLGCGNYDVLFVYDYNDLSIPPAFNEFSKYENKSLITWSMGVFAAYQVKDLFKEFNYKLAINGTTTPVDDEFGIPVKMFELTLKHAQKGLEGKFYKNVFHTENEFEKYQSQVVQRTVENRVNELENLYNLIRSKIDMGYEKFYDLAIVSDFDKIIPPKNQIASHKRNNIPVSSYTHLRAHDTPE